MKNMLPADFVNIIEIIGHINKLHETTFILDLAACFDTSLVYCIDHGVNPNYTIFLNNYLQHLKPAVQYLLDHPERIEFILKQHKGHEAFVFNEFAGNLAGLHFISPGIFS